MPAVPMIDDIALSAVQVIRQSTSLDLAPAKVMGLAGRVHRNFGRSGHRVELSGLLLGETAGDDLAALQEKAAGGEEAEPLYDLVCERLGAKKGIFGADMEVDLVNDGPVTLLLEA